MKKILLSVAALAVAQLNAFAQNVQAGLKPGSVAAQTVVTLKNNGSAAIVGNYLSSLTVSIRIPDQGANNPSLIVSGLSGTTPSVSVSPTPDVLNGFAYYLIGCTYSGNQAFPMAVSQEKDILAFSFQGTSGTALISSVEMVDFTDGGPSGQNQFYFSIAGVGLNNQASPFYATPQSSSLDNAGNPRKIGIGSVPLSVTWLDFTAAKSGEQVILNWATATERNNTGFDVERSADGKHFSKIGFVSTMAIEGNSSEKLAYTFIDSKPLNGTNHYRLKQIDIDGKSSLSKTLAVKFGKDAAVQVYPNPAQGGTVRINGNNISNIAVFNISGQQVNVPVNYGVSENILNTSSLASGNYIVRVATEGSVQTIKLVIQR